jgi:protein arginine N-methyltransferase 1
MEASMTNLNRDTVLQRVPNLKIKVDSNNNIKIYFGGRVIQVGVHGLTILDAFYQPTSIHEVLSKFQLRIKGVQDWMDYMTTVIHLYKAGILRDETQDRPELGTKTSGFDTAPIHIAMLNDKRRTLSFLMGIQEVVQPGDVVLDIGTGTGILAMAAVRAGARHVYAIEASGIGKLANAVFKANGLTDRITLIEGWSTQINLPERADVLVSEMIGNEPMAENTLEITTDAMKRLIKPEARLIPNKIRIVGLPVTIPQNELKKHIFMPETIRKWKSWYEIDFSPLVEVARISPHQFFINPFLTRDWKALSAPVVLADIDLKHIKDLTMNNAITVTANTSGELDGILEYFELEICPTEKFSTNPGKADETNHWLSPVWVLPEPILLQPGDQFTVTYQYRKTEDRTQVNVSLL